MTARRLATIDAQIHWMARTIPSDQFLLYGFAEPAVELEPALQALAERARGCADLNVRIAESGFWSYPTWEPSAAGPDRFLVHDGDTWAGCLSTVAALTDGGQLDATRECWRLHVFPSVAEMPTDGAGSVVALQISHALADGIRASALAAYLLGRDGPAPSPTGTYVSATQLPRRAVVAARAQRRLMRDVAAGLVPPQAVCFPALRTNAQPVGQRHLRTVFRDRAQVSSPTVTVGVLSAVSSALAGHLRDLGDDVASLGAEVPMARAGPRRANNHYGNVAVGLFPDVDAGSRPHRIATELYARRRRAAHPAMRADAAAFAAMPAPLLRWGVGQFDPEVRSPTVTGNTVVSSVNRGAEDLSFGGAPVVLTAGFATPSPMMGMNHGVHGIGDTVAISVHAAESSIGDIDAYVERLEGELR